MRLYGALLALAAASAASAETLEAKVYLFGRSREATIDFRVPSVEPEQAKLLFTRYLGLSRQGRARDADEETLALFNTIGEQKPLFSSDEENEETDKLMIMIEGVGKPEGIFTNAQSPIFAVSNPPSSISNSQLATTLIGEDAEWRDSQLRCQDGSAFPDDNTSEYTRGGYSDDDPIGSCLLLSGQAKRGWTAALKYESDLLKLQGHGTKVFHTDILEKLAALHGAKSKKYADAQSMLKSAVNDIISERGSKVTLVVLMPTSTGNAQKGRSWGDLGASLEKRQASAERPLPPAEKKGPPKTGPKDPAYLFANSTSPKISGSMQVCYKDLKTCNDATNNCSEGHGECVKKYTGCTACKCKSTPVEGMKGKTISWAGAACQKKDVSSPFWLLAGITILLVLAITYGISLLYSIGEEELPSVIGAGVAGPRASK